MSRTTLAWLPALVAGALALAPAAKAQVGGSEEARAYSVERFRLATDRGGVLDVEWGGIPRHLWWNVYLWTGYADDPLVVYRLEDDARGASLVGHQIGGALGGSIALFEWFSVGLEVPLVFAQGRAATGEGIIGTLPDLSSFAIGDLRLRGKVRILRQEGQGIDLAIAPTLGLPTASTGDYVGEKSVTLLPELLISRSFGPVRLALNAGVMLRGLREVANLTVDNELRLRAGLGFRIAEVGGPPLELDVTSAVGTLLSSPFSASNTTAAELLGALAYHAGWVSVYAAGGPGLSRGAGTPDFRVLVGVRVGPPDDADTDKDGILDRDDECPEIPEDKDGFEDEDGCPDTDNDKDKILDAADRCPNEPETYNKHEDTDGCPDDVPDTDKDGLKDDVDRCPKEPEDKDGFEDEDGCPDPDNDGDTVLDPKDKCPNVAGPVENRGCPDTDRDEDSIVDRMDQCPDEPGSPMNMGCPTKQLVKVTTERIEILEKVYFDVNKSTIQRRSFALLENVVAALGRFPTIKKVRIEGHTDSDGPDDYNLKLSQRRVEAVRDFLVDRGVEVERLEAVGFGETQPIADNKTRDGKAENRRVEFRIVEWAEDVVE